MMILKKKLLKNGIIFDPYYNSVSKQDILIDKNGIIENISLGIEDNEADIYDLEGFYICPGLTDLHTHTRNPGEGEESLQSIEKSALRGGFTRITVMPNTNPPLDNLDSLLNQLKMWKDSTIQAEIVCCLTEKSMGKQLNDLKLLKEYGCSGFSDDGKWTKNSYEFLKGLITAGELGCPVFSHTEDHHIPCFNPFENISMMNNTGVSESLAAVRDMILSEISNQPLHLCHISDAYSLARIEEFLVRNCKITVEAAPHYFSLNSNVIQNNNGFYKVNPPLKSENDRLKVIESLKNDTIKVIATDHAPHLKRNKEKSFSESRPGFVGLETALPAAITYLYHPGHLSFLEIVKKMTIEPLKILNKPFNRFQNGLKGDLIVVNPWKEWLVSENNLVSQSKNSPFLGTNLKGKIEIIISKGNLIKQND